VTLDQLRKIGWTGLVMIITGVAVALYLQRDKLGLGDLGKSSVNDSGGTAQSGTSDGPTMNSRLRKICEAEMARTVRMPQQFRDKYGYDISVDRCEIQEMKGISASDGETYWMGKGACHLSDGKSVEPSSCAVLQCADKSYPKPTNGDSLGSCDGRPDRFGRTP